MTYEQALREARFQAVTCGGVSRVNGKELTGKNGYWYLDDVRVENPDEEVLAFVEVDEMYVRSLVTE